MPPGSGGKDRMSTSEYLNEEKYQKGRKTLIYVAILILLLGLVIGGGLIVDGIIKKNFASKIDSSMPTYSTGSNVDENMRKSSEWMEKTSQKGDEGFAATAMIGGGGFIIFASFVIALPLFVLANQRKIIAFQAQTIAPVAKEGIEKATPVVGKAAGSVAKEVAKGIKEGLKDEPIEKKIKREKPEK